MKEEKGIIKNKSSIYKKAVVSFLVTLAVINGGCAIAGNIILADYPSHNQIKSIAKELDCDTSYISKDYGKFLKMQHNGNEPIYVNLDDGLTEFEKTCAVKSLDYVFGIVGSINDKYHYQLVDEASFKEKTFKTKIKIKIGKENVEKNDSEGFINSKGNLLSIYTNKATLYEYVINQNRMKEPLDEKQMRYVYTHELLHAFGLRDVYLGTHTKKFQGNTIMKAGLGKVVDIVTPNDLKCLMSLYCEKFDNDKDRKEAVYQYKQTIEQYQEKYYQYFASVVKEKYQAQDFDYDDFKWQAKAQFTAIANQQAYTYYYNVTVIDDKYTFEILNADKTAIGGCSGQVLRNDGVVILKELDLENGFTPGIPGSPNGYVQDYAMIKNEGLVYLIDVTEDKVYFGFTSKIASFKSFENLIN